MIVSRKLSWKVILYYTWKDLLYYLFLSVTAFLIHDFWGYEQFSIPFNTVTALSTALAIFLGFKNNNAYDRWWEARKIWGLLVNYSRAFTREVITMIAPENGPDTAEAKELQHRMVYRHIAFVHSLRVFLRETHDYNQTEQEELFEERNEYSDTKSFLPPNEYSTFSHKKNPPNYLLELQGEDLKTAYKNGWLSDYRFVRLEETLIEFNNIQGMSERIKNTPFPRQYSFFSRVFVFIHATLLPFAFVSQMGLATVPVSLVISFVFLALDLVGERTEDPFENRLEDVPLTSLCKTIETNVKEQWGATDFPHQPRIKEGIVM